MEDQFELTLASWVGERDGMAVELHDGTADPVAEVFHDDDTGAVTVTIFNDRPVPFIAMERLMTRARKEFPSATPLDGGSST